MKTKIEKLNDRMIEINSELTKIMNRDKWAKFYLMKEKYEIKTELLLLDEKQMQKYIKDWLKSRGHDENDYIKCEMCGFAQVQDVHHIESSMRGERKHKINGSDLIGLCRRCHNIVHSDNNFETRQKLLNKVQKILNINS